MPGLSSVERPLGNHAKSRMMDTLGLFEFTLIASYRCC